MSKINRSIKFTRKTALIIFTNSVYFLTYGINNFRIIYLIIYFPDIFIVLYWYVFDFCITISYIKNKVFRDLVSIFNILTKKFIPVFIYRKEIILINNFSIRK